MVVLGVGGGGWVKGETGSPPRLPFFIEIFAFLSAAVN